MHCMDVNSLSLSFSLFHTHTRAWETSKKWQKQKQSDTVSRLSWALQIRCDMDRTRARHRGVHPAMLCLLEELRWEGAPRTDKHTWSLLLGGSGVVTMSLLLLILFISLQCNLCCGPRQTNGTARVCRSHPVHVELYVIIRYEGTIITTADVWFAGRECRNCIETSLVLLFICRSFSPFCTRIWHFNDTNNLI